MHTSLTTLTLAMLTLIPHAISTPWPSQSFKSFPYESPVISWTKSGAPTTPGYLFFAPIGTDADNGGFDAPTIMTDEGEVVWRAPSDSLNGTRNTNMQSLPGGEGLVTYWTGDHNAGYGCGYGAVIMLDDTYSQAYNVCMADLPVIPIQGTYITNPCTLDSHESRITARGTLLASVRNMTQVDLTAYGGSKDGYLLDSQFYEINITTSAVILRWSAYEHASQLNTLSLSTTRPNKGVNPQLPWDFFHMNSIYDVPEPLGGYIVSSRYCSSIIKLDSSGNVEWYVEGTTGGNFTMPSDGTGNFSFQHDVLAANVTATSLQLTIYDNANKDGSTPKMESSGLELGLNLTTKEITVLRRLVPDNFTATPHTGSYQTMYNGHVLLDYGNPAIFNEFDGDGNIIYTASASSLDGEVYRCNRRNWTAIPATPPSIVTEAGSNGKTTAYVSWNGATGVSAWQFAAGSACTGMTALGTAYNRTGFETTVELNVPSGSSHVMALAMGTEAGVVMGQSVLVAASGGNSTAGGSAVVDCAAGEAVSGLSTTSMSSTSMSFTSSSVVGESTGTVGASTTTSGSGSATTTGASASAKKSGGAAVLAAMPTGGVGAALVVAVAGLGMLV